MASLGSLLIGVSLFKRRVRAKEDAKNAEDLKDDFSRMTQDLKETTFSRNFLNSILKSMVTPLIVTDPEQKIMMVNKATCYLLGYKREEEIIGKPLIDIFTEAVKESAEANKIVKLLNQGIMYYETTFTSKHGDSIPALISGSSIRQDNGDILWTICTAVDISKRKEAEERLIKAYEDLKSTQSQLIQAEKMDAIGRMASGIAHEVKNPLGIILQGVNCLEMRLPPGQKDTFEVLRKMKNNVERADSIIKDLLDFSRLTDLKLVKENINSALESSLSLVYHRVKMDKIKIAKDLADDLPYVMIDKRKIEQVLINCLLNAMQAMSKGGTLTLRSYEVTVGEDLKDIWRRAKKHFCKGEKGVAVEIEDTGSGIKKEDLDKIFEPFFTTKETQDGTGLGLSVSNNIVELHKGVMHITSEFGKGTKVTVLLKAVVGGG